MPNTERIESLISPEALKQFEQLKPIVDANTASFEKLIAKAVELNKAVGNATTFKEVNKATQEMTANEKALAKQVDELAKANAKLQTLYSDEAKKIAEIKVQQQEQNKILKDQAKEALGLVGAYDKLTKEYNEAAKAAKDLAAQYGAGSKQAKEASARALELDARLKAADANVGRFNKNVGNYSGALDTLKKALQDVSKRIDDNTKSGQQNVAVMESLQKEQSLLQSLVDAQSKGFANATGEIRNNQQAILLLSQVYGEDSAVIQELTKKTAELTDTVGDMKATIKAQASDTHVFDGLISAAQGLVGIYSVAQGAAALFGNENEELQKTFVKLQSVMAVLQGLQAIQNALQKESAARQLLNIGLQKVQVLQTRLATAAESQNVIVKYAAIAAQKALNFATSAAGGPLLILIGLLATAAVVMASYGEGTESAAKQNERLNKSLERSNQNIDKGAAAIKARSDKTIATLEENFSKEEDIRKERERAAEEEIGNLKRINDADLRNRIANQKTIDRLNKEKAKSGLDEDEQKELDEALKIKDSYLANLQKQTDAENGIEILRLQNSRATKEEIIKAKQDEIEAQKIQLQTSLQLQQNIAGNERKTQTERIKALQEAQRLQAQIINKDANSKLLNPELTPSQIKVIEATRTAALTQARRESNKAIEDLNRSYAERERKARFDIVKTEIEDQIKATDLIANNEAKSFNDRTDALFAGYEKRRDIIVAQHEFDIKNDTLTAEERLAIEQKFLSDINNLTIDYGLQQQAIYQHNTDKVNDIIEKNLQRRKDIISGNESDAIVALNEQLKAGLITTEEYSRQRGKIEKSARIQQIKEEINDLTGKKIALISQQKQQSNEFISIEEAEKKKRKELSDELTDEVIANEQRMTDLKKQLASEYFETFNAFASAQFENEIARIQQQMAEVDRQKEHDIAAANATITNKQERETAIARIEVRAQAERERLERRQRQIELERARFEKAANIAQIIGNTAVAIMNQLKVTPLPAGAPFIAAIGTIGALQLARAIAAPLPKFAEGTIDAPGGLAWVGDGFRRELVVTPQGQVIQTPAVPTVMNVPKHSIVLPDARKALESGLAVNQHGRLVQNENQDIREVGRKIDVLTKVMRNKPVLNMNATESGLTAMWNYGANTVAYIEEQTRF
jgi:hypothetical protein